MQYSPIICPHTDRWNFPAPEADIPGWRHSRDGLAESLSRPPKQKVARAGHLNALYTIRANIMPGAFSRSVETYWFQQAVEMAISRLEREEE